MCSEHTAWLLWNWGGTGGAHARSQRQVFVWCATSREGCGLKRPCTANMETTGLGNADFLHWKHTPIQNEITREDASIDGSNACLQGMTTKSTAGNAPASCSRIDAVCGQAPTAQMKEPGQEWLGHRKWTAATILTMAAKKIPVGDGRGHTNTTGQYANDWACATGGRGTQTTWPHGE